MPGSFLLAPSSKCLQRLIASCGHPKKCCSANVAPALPKRGGGARGEGPAAHLRLLLALAALHTQRNLLRRLRLFVEHGLGLPTVAGLLPVVPPLAWANERLAKAQRLKAVELRDEFPRNALGKVIKRELRAPYWEAS